MIYRYMSGIDFHLNGSAVYLPKRSQTIKNKRKRARAKR